MRKGLTLLEIAFALLALSLLALFVLEPFTRVLLASQEVGPLERALSRAQEVLEGYRANPPGPIEGCGAPISVGGGVAYEVCSFDEGPLVRYEVRVRRDGFLVTAFSSLHPRGDAAPNPPPVLQEVYLDYTAGTLRLTFSEQVSAPSGAVTLVGQRRSCFLRIFCSSQGLLLTLGGLPAVGNPVTLSVSPGLLTDRCIPLLLGCMIYYVDYTYAVSVSSAVEDLGSPPQPLSNPGTFTCSAPSDAPGEVCQP